MGLFNPSENSINLKIVYYGPAYGGKTTNLSHVKRVLDPAGEQGVLSLNTGDDTTLFFDYLPLRFRLLDRYQIRVQGYTVPGQVKFNTTRRLVLKGTDGVVFVADSSRRRLRDNVDSLLNLHSNMSDIGLDPSRVPLVMQYNKQDSEDRMSPEELDAGLNQAGHPYVPAVAIEGTGVFDSFRLVLQRVVERAHAEYQLARRGLPLDVMLSALNDALFAATEPKAGKTETGIPADRTIIRVPDPAAAPFLEGDSTDGLLEGAVTAGIELSSLAAHLAEQRNQAIERVGEIVETGQRVLHDLRKPIAALKNALYLLGRVKLEDSGERALQMAREVTDHMEGLLGGFTEELKHRESYSMGDEPVDLAQLASDVARRLSYFANGHGVELRVQPGLPRVLGSPEGLTSVIANLVSNAVQYHDPSKAERFVEVSGRVVSRGFLLGVRDNGRGIPASDRPKVFTKYNRGSNTQGVGGTGLGLYMVREIVRAHGGRLGLRSRLGRGSLFYVLIPARRLEENLSIASLREESGVRSPGSGSRRA